MNKKLIAMAVTATLAAPLAAQADDGGVILYGRINNAIDITDVDGGERTTDLTGISSRFGIKYSADIGNGMTASARYEFSTRTDRELQGGNSLRETAAGDVSADSDRFALDTRIGTVGLSGAFGSVTLGNQWSAFYNTVGTHLDPTYTLGYYLYSSIVGGPYRSSNTVQYANSFGPVSLQLDARFNESGESADVAERLAGDGFGIGVTVNATENLMVAVAFDAEDRDDGSFDNERTGIVVKGNFGPVWASLGYQNNEDNLGGTETEQTQLWVGGAAGENTSWMLGYGQAERDTSDVEPTAFNYGVYHKLGGGLKAYVEGVSIDADDSESASDLDRVLLGMRIDF